MVKSKAAKRKEKARRRRETWNAGEKTPVGSSGYFSPDDTDDDSGVYSPRLDSLPLGNSAVSKAVLTEQQKWEVATPPGLDVTKTQAGDVKQRGQNKTPFSGKVMKYCDNWRDFRRHFLNGGENNQISWKSAKKLLWGSKQDPNQPAVEFVCHMLHLFDQLKQRELVTELEQVVHIQDRMIHPHRLLLQQHKVTNQLQLFQACLTFSHIEQIGSGEFMEEDVIVDFFKRGVVCVGRSGNLKTVINRSGPNDTYVLYYKKQLKARDPELWKKNKDLFLQFVDSMSSHLEEACTSFVFVDCDARPDLACATNDIAIVQYKGGKIVTKDVLHQQSCIATLCVAKSDALKPAIINPKKRTALQLPCPGSFRNQLPCDHEDRTWFCATCLQSLEYCFDDLVYCGCGRAPATSFYFKCVGSDHGLLSFLPYPEEQLCAGLRKLKPKEEINILILGETGVGKSTFINGFVNYLTFDSLQTASEHDKLINLIACQFTVLDEDFKEQVIKVGDDKNEIQKMGQSATQFPKAYTFTHGEKLVRLIDTPGIGDTRGIDQDQENFNNILIHLSDYDQLHGICILLKPNNSRLGVMFRFCVKELLSHLHKDASSNIVFCFTNSRSTSYRPGDTFGPLKVLISECKDVVIELSKETVYCMDNESFRFLAELKNGINHEEIDKENFEVSWEKSVTETERLLNHVMILKPHLVKNTLSLNDARRMIVKMTKPIAYISQNIQANISAVEDSKQLILTSQENKMELAKNLTMPQIDLVAAPLGYPRTVCTNSTCIEVITFGGKKKINYKTHCHPHCGLSGVQTDIINCIALQGCDAMDSSRTRCKVCGCSWDVHMHVTYELNQVQHEIEDVNVKQQITSKEEAIVAIEEHIVKLECRRDEFNEEQRKIIEVSVKFGHFLKQNSIVPYNDALIEYLDHLIKEEKIKISAGGLNHKTLEKMEEMRASYQEEVRILNEAMNSDAVNVTPKDINGLVESLYDLPLTGTQLKGIMIVAEKTSAQMMEYQEYTYTPNVAAMGFRKQNSLQNMWHGFTNKMSSLVQWRY